jgi:pyrimidine deaminase RibD-like protein/NTP pyrophosphatase (non-canonical NTP hydrolase)
MGSDREREWMGIAIKEARKSRHKPGRVHPEVGAVVARGDELLDLGFHGEGDLCDHAEFVVLEKKNLCDTSLVGCTVYTTLEPCTTRGHPKVPSAHRLVERKVDRVVIGMLDPNPSICGKGVRLLRDHNVKTEFFPHDLAAEVEDMNRHFTRGIELKLALREVDKEFVEQYRSRDLDEWYKAINYIYTDRNFYRDAPSIFAHLVEVVGGLSRLASEKKKSGPRAETFLPKALAWWFALCGKLGVTSTAELLWLKFPGVCPYCQKEEHDPTFCSKKKRENPVPPWKELRVLGRKKTRPRGLGEWQRMFRGVYKLHHKPDFQAAFARLAEELGELGEAIRVFPAAPGYFLSEAADVFAWLMNIQNNIDFRDERPEEEYGRLLEESVCQAYPDYCTDCTRQRCICAPILESTIGRIAHELPADPELFDINAMFMPSDKARSVFRPPK